MSRLHPYMRAYLKTNGKFRKILKHYGDLKFNKGKGKPNIISNPKSQIAGGIIEVDNFIFEENIDEDDDRIQIFVGDQNECVLAFIDKLNPNTVWLEYFKYHQYCNIDKNLIHGEGTFKMMSAFIKYIKQNHPEVKTIKLSDKAEFICHTTNINLYKLYMLKYGKSFYEQRFEFILDTFENTNKPELIESHYKNIANSKHIKIDKAFIIEEFNKLLQNIKTLYKPYLTAELINEFTSKLENDEFVRDFLMRFKIPDNQCAIFEDFLDIIFNNYLDTLIISIGGIYSKNLYINRNIDRNRNKKLTKKKRNSISSKHTKKANTK